MADNSENNDTHDCNRLEFQLCSHNANAHSSTSGGTPLVSHACRYISRGTFIKGIMEGRGEVSYFPPGAIAGTKTYCDGMFSGGEMMSGTIRFAQGDPYQRNIYFGPTRGISPPMAHGPQGRLQYTVDDVYVGSFVSVAAVRTRPGWRGMGAGRLRRLSKLPR